MYDSSEQQNVALGRVGPLVLAEAPEVPGDIGEQTGVRSLQFSQALAGHSACLPVGAMVGAVDNDQQQFDQALDVTNTKPVKNVEGDKNGRSGDEHLVFKRERNVRPLKRGLDHETERVEEAVQ